MEILEINPRPGIELNEKFSSKFKNFEHLIEILRKRQLPDDVVNLVNEEIAGINAITGTDKLFIAKAGQPGHSSPEQIDHLILLNDWIIRRPL